MSLGATGPIVHSPCNATVVKAQIQYNTLEWALLDGCSTSV